MSANSYPSPSSIQTDESQRPLISRNIVIATVVGVIVLLVGFAVFVVWLALRYPDQIEAVRDIFIMLFALVSCASVLVLVMVLVAMVRLINMLEFEIKPILHKTNETMGALQGTTQFVSQNVVQPAITLRSRLAGLRRGAKVLFGNAKNNLPE